LSNSAGSRFGLAISIDRHADVIMPNKFLELSANTPGTSRALGLSRVFGAKPFWCIRFGTLASGFF
jgi:uncharacterized membrane protein